MNAAWPAMCQVFAVRWEKMLALLTWEEAPWIERYSSSYFVGQHPLSFLIKHPVDLLTVNKGCDIQSPRGYETFHWGQLLNHTDKEIHPKVVANIWSSDAQIWEKGPAEKACQECCQEQGYSTSFFNELMLHKLEVLSRKFDLLQSKLRRNGHLNGTCPNLKRMPFTFGPCPICSCLQSLTSIETMDLLHLLGTFPTLTLNQCLINHKLGPGLSEAFIICTLMRWLAVRSSNAL